MANKKITRLEEFPNGAIRVSVGYIDDTTGIPVAPSDLTSPQLTEWNRVLNFLEIAESLGIVLDPIVLADYCRANF